MPTKRADFRTAGLALLGILLSICFAAKTQAGYRLESAWDPDSSIVTWSVSVESGSPEPFKDFHVSVTGGYAWHYAKAEAPPGWEMRLVWTEGYWPKCWLSFWGNYAVQSAVFAVRYTVPGDTTSGREWRLTNDGDRDPWTGVIDGEGGVDALVPYRRGVNRTTKAAVHVLPHSDTRTCGRDFPSVTGCQDIITTCAENDVDFFPVFYDLIEYTGVEFSVFWPGTYSCVFTSCSDVAAGTIRWPAGQGDPELWDDFVTYLWDECQPGPTAIPGWGWLYEPAPAMICIVPSRKSGVVSLIDCANGPNWPRCDVCAGFAGATGGVTCGASAIEGKTWGAIKAMFE